MVGWPTAWHPVRMDATELTAIARRYRRAEAASKAAREELQRASLEAMADGVKQVDVARITGWTRETLRKLTPPAGE